ncbi:hypothetical protein [Pseudolysinimonas yzui]|nr:hypothetical protein [Pseudolysinimonas yzui]
MIRVSMDGYTAEKYRYEALGLELVKHVIRRAGLLGTQTANPLIPKAIGPDFTYESNPTLFAGRAGRGPLTVVLDTNLLIDYFENGWTMWRGESLPELHPGEYGEHLEALQLILAVWVSRDIELMMLEESLHDTRGRTISSDRDKRNRNGWDEFYRALSHSPHRPTKGIPAPVPPRIVELITANVPVGGDRRLIRAALNTEAHVFLTRDKDLLRLKADLRGLGLSILSPGDLLEALSAYGALNFLWDPASLYWPMPDQEKVAHMIWALPAPPG